MKPRIEFLQGIPGKGLSITMMIFSMILLFTFCNKEDDPLTPDLGFIGSESCKTCHAEKYTDWVASGHPYKFTVIEDGE